MIHRWPAPINEHEARLLSAHLCEYACDGKRGRPESRTGVYGEVTEGRDFGAGYSSCADLPHWFLYLMGVRYDFINRVEHKGWRQGLNIGLLCQMLKAPWARIPDRGQRFAWGDILVIWNDKLGRDAHATVVLDDRGDVIETANYGSPGGMIAESRRVGDRLGTLQRKIQRWINLGDLLRRAQADGKLVDAQDPTLGEDGTVLWRPPT